MPVILQGSLDRFPAAVLLPFLVAHAQSGTLALERGSKRTRIFLRDGRIDWTEASNGLGAEEAILDCVAWDDGTFSLQDEAVLPDGATPLGLDPAVLIEEGLRRAQAMREALGAFQPEQEFEVITERDEKDQISLSHDEFTVLFRIGAGRTLAALAKDLGRPMSDVIPTILKLQTGGLIREKSAPPPPPPPPAPIESSDATTLSSAKRLRTLAGSLTPSGTGTVHPLLDTEYTIGRDAANTIVIPDGSVSSKHARVIKTADGFVLEDLNSRNGTFVNGERVTGTTLLNDNDVVRFGRVILTFNAATEEVPGSATNPGSA